MFKLLAIRPLPGCASYIQKCLKPELMYYFCNDYIIEPNSHIRRRSKNLKPLKENFFTVDSQSDYFRINSSETIVCPKVNVSAVVGMNGDGKSTLVELMIRLINNCAISYNLCSSQDNLRRVKGVKAELYYMVGNVVYRIAEEKKKKEPKIWKVATLEDTDDNGDATVSWKVEQTAINLEDIPNCFYFTIVSNYSHYAYNIYDYEKEWEVRGGEKDDDEKCWLHYIFHKNDGYLTPITLHPLRYKGNIDINNEKWLSKQRLLSLFLNADNPSKNPISFRRVNGKDANLLKLMEESSSKLQQKVLLDYFEATNEENKFRDLIEKVNLGNDELFQMVMFMDLDENDSKSYDSIDVALSSHFIKPINQIIEQDNGRFSIFANGVADWMIHNDKYRKRQYNGDIITLIRHYENLFRRNETFIQIDQCNQNAMKNALEGNYHNTLQQYNKAKDICEEKFGKDHIFISLIYNDIAVAYEYLNMFDEALTNYEMALSIKESVLGKDHQSTAITYNNMVGVFKAKGDYNMALEYASKAMNIFSKDPLLMAKTYNNTAIVYESKGDYGEAIDFYHKAISIIEANENSHPDIATTYNNVAGAYEKNNDHLKALDYYEKALNFRKEEFGEDHLNVAKIYNDMAIVYAKMDENEKALDYFNTALLIRSKIQGAEHLDMASLYYNIAWVYIAKEDYKKAYVFLDKSLYIRKKYSDAGNDIATSYCNLAWVCSINKEYEKSLRYYKEALGVMEKGSLDFTATAYDDMAGVYVGMGKYSIALREYEEAKEIRLFLENNIDLATTYNNMAVVYMLQGDYNDYNKAIELLSSALSIRISESNSNQLEIATTHDNMAMTYKAQGNHIKALQHYREALKIKKAQGLKRMEIDLCMSYRKIGWEYYNNSDYNNALNSFKNALRTIEKFESIDKQEVIQCYKIIAGVYLSMGNSESARNYYVKAMNMIDSGKRKKNKDIVIEYDKISIVQSDRLLERYEKDELIKQVVPKKKQSGVHLEDGEMEKIWENHDRIKKMMLNMKKQDLIDTTKHKFLNSINATQLGRLDTIYRIMKSNKIDWRIVTKNYSDLTLEEKCYHYKVYKIWSILSTYPQYKKALDMGESLKEFRPEMEKYVNDIINDRKSHISRKLRQVESFINEGLQNGGLYERLKTTRGKFGELLIELDKLKEHYSGKTFSLDNLPPPIYKWDVIFNKKDDYNNLIELDSFSSGEKQMLNSIGSIIYHLQNLSNTASNISYPNVNLIMEEIELYYHPEYQRLFFSRLLDMIKRARLQNIKNINIVFVTHSPFILSDIPKCNVLFLKDGMPKDDMQENTFGANIHSLLKNGFFMPNLPIGEFAYEKINKLFGKMNSGDIDSIDTNYNNELEDIYQEILLVGEPFLRNRLLLLYNAYKGNRQISQY